MRPTCYIFRRLYRLLAVILCAWRVVRFISACGVVVGVVTDNDYNNRDILQFMPVQV